jgi:predicted metal-dependent phosphoesterase TrpH
MGGGWQPTPVEPLSRVDLHVHSCESDGAWTPEHLAEHAASIGMRAIALCDHDTVRGLARAVARGAELGVDVVPGVELSCEVEGRDIHILGYFVDAEDPALLASLASLRDGRLERAETMVRELTAGGYPVRLEDVLVHASGDTVGRSHVARALVDRGHAGDVREAFARFIGHGKPYYVDKPLPGPDAAIGTIHASGGLAVVAHPAASGAEDLIGLLAEAGLDGIEAYHAEHGPDTRARLAWTAEELGLLVTGGTDFHGPGSPNPGIGMTVVPEDCYDALLAARRPR